MARTRLGQFGVGLDVYAGFSAKGGIDKGVVTRLTAIGVGGAKYRTFLAKAQATPAEPPAEVPHFFGVGASRRLRAITGKAEIVLPLLKAEAFGVHVRAGDATVILPAIEASAVGVVGSAGLARVAIEVTGHGSNSVIGSGSDASSLRVVSLGSVSRVGVAELSLELHARATGNHDPDEPAIIAMLLAA